MTRKWHEADLPRDICAYRTPMWVFLILIVAWSGIRFADGNMLLGISRGVHPDDPSLQGFGQWLWDSPLKVGLLRILPPNVIAIGLAFAIVGVLPAVGLLSRNPRILWLTAATLFLTPAFKVSIQNLGVGDGALMFLVLCLCSSPDRRIIFFAVLMAALWHPHQSCFVCVSYLLGRYCYERSFDRRSVLAVGAALATGLTAFVIYKHLLPFSFEGRSAFMAKHGGDDLVRNLMWSPIALAPIVLWLLVIAPRPTRFVWWLFAWILALAVMATLTTDVTRILTITTLPIVLIGAKKIIDDRLSLSAARVAATAIPIALLPQLNWSGLDYLLWPALMGDLCKWHLYCAAL